MCGRNLCLALNIKADGLAVQIKDILGRYDHTNYFTFDMSLPEQVKQVRAGLRVYSGLSDFQKTAPLLESCEGVWLDSFNGDWFEPDLVDDLLTQGKAVCIVSSELHERNPVQQWKNLLKIRQISNPHIQLCTDRPVDASRFFGV